MHSPKMLLMLLASIALGADFSGTSALRYTERVVSFGPRPPGSAAIRKLQSYIIGELNKRQCEVLFDAFNAQTPVGVLPMKNIVARFKGSTGRIIAITGHYDTKLMRGMNFVGANDGGSSTGFLLEMARALSGRPRKDDVYLVWFDGEEAIAEWSETDGAYGSRHLAKRWYEDGTASRLKALINVDMIGDKDLGILQVTNSSDTLRRLVWKVAVDLGYSRYFLNEAVYVDDDHMAFYRLGMNALNLIDFQYGPQNSYWHTARDTVDKLSAHSFEVVGAVLLETIRRLEQTF